MEKMDVCGKEYKIIRLLGHGKGGYSYLAEIENQMVVLKQIHHEPCDYYSFGNKIEAERSDYERLKNTGIRIPEMLAIDIGAERIVKEYIEGRTIFELVRDNISVDLYLNQVREMAEIAKAAGINIDYFPTNFVVQDNLIWYVSSLINDTSYGYSSDSRLIMFGFILFSETGLLRSWNSMPSATACSTSSLRAGSSSMPRR